MRSENYENHENRIIIIENHENQKIIEFNKRKSKS